MLRNQSLLAVFAFSLFTQACGARVVAFSDDAPVSDAVITDAPTSTDVALPPSNCEPGTWCWITPSPRGIAMNAVFTVSATEAWAVGQQGATMRYVGGRWVPYPAITTVDLRGIWGSGPNDVWAWGSQQDTGAPNATYALVRWNGTQWSTVAHGPLPSIQGLDGSAADNVWLATSSNTTSAIRRWNGTSFVDLPALPNGGRVQSICVRSTTEAWATAGDARNSHPIFLYRFDGTSWSLAHRAPEGSSERFSSAVVCPADGVALVEYFSFDAGVTTYIEVRNGRVGGDMLPLTGSPDLVRTPHGDAYFFNGSQAMRWTSMGWQGPINGGNGSTFSSKFDLLRDGSAGWMALGSPFLSTWSGGAWRVDPQTVDKSLSVFVNPGSTPTDPVAIIGQQVWANRAMGSWRIAPTPTVANGLLLEAHRAWGADANQVWIVGAGGAIAKYDQRTNQITPATVVPDIGAVELLAVHGSDAANVWAVGRNATVLRLEGDRWVAPPVALPRMVDGVQLTTISLTAVHVASANDVLIMGDDPAGGRFITVLFRWNGTAWTAESNGGGETPAHIARDAAGNVYSLVRGRVTRRPAAGGMPVEISAASELSIQDLHVSPSGAIELFATDRRRAALYELDSMGRFNVVGAPLDVEGITSIVRGANGSLWATGAFGAILRYEPRR
ncbi:MAG: hypothetical protein JNK05_22150 [Myxococcales bacterium]|nr:hypothetical protein [Myxococcales bacterium]